MFLTWTNQSDAETSLTAVHAVYGCAYEGDSGYTMGSWDTVTKSDNAELWGFEKPKEMLGKTQSELDAALVAGYTEGEKPSDWVNAKGV